MLVLLSPAKTLDLNRPPIATHSQPLLLDQALQLVGRLRELSVAEVATLMGLSDKLAELNHARYQAFAPTQSLDNAKQALLTFKGDVYRGLDVERYSEDDLAFAQANVRILSGLYGVLRPLDLVQPYRLEMGTRLENSRGRDLYRFWGDRITTAVNDALAATGDDVVVHCASDEYFRAVNPAQLNGRVVRPVFKDYKNGTYKVLQLFAKRARGLMTSFIVRGRVTSVEQLRDFDWDGYRFDPDGSSDAELLFLRRQS